MIKLFRILKNCLFVFSCLMALGVSQAFAQSCVPSCEEGDGKLIYLLPRSIGDLSTLAGEPMRLRIRVDETEDDLELFIFDPDHTSTWDPVGNDDDGTTGNAILSYTLYADPDRADDSMGLTEVFQLLSNDVDAAACPQTNFIANPYSPGDPGSVCNHAWRGLTIENSDEAHDGDDHYNYLLEVEFQEAGIAVNGSSFKVRVDNGEVFLFPGDLLSLSGHAGGRDQSALPLIFTPFQDCMFPDEFPNTDEFPTCECAENDISGCTSPDDSSYDGRITFDALFEPGPDEIITELVLWDGDVDYGNGSAIGPDDDDDPDTQIGDRPDAGMSTFAEDERADPTGSPPENTNDPVFQAARETPPIYQGAPVIYELVAPNGTRYVNTNPSGDREWERFSIRLNDHPDGCVVNVDADFCIDHIPAGVWRANILGLDIGNFIFFSAEMSVMRVAPVPTLTPWGMMILIVLFGMVVLLTLRQRGV